MAIKQFVYALLLAISLPACAVDRGRAVPDEQLEPATDEALQAGDFGRAIDLALPKAQAGDPEYQFSVGYLALVWLEAASPKKPPRYSSEEAMSWIGKAAAQDSPQAAGILRSGYEWGRYMLPKNAALEVCWRKVESEEQGASICTDMERKAGFAAEN
ncbi:hypothetical protein AB4059_15625 [Lysobacter sp. 2RAF19]